MYSFLFYYIRNWDKLVGEIKEEEKNEKLEGDVVLNKLFQQIYLDGFDEVKRVMNKLFVRKYEVFRYFKYFKIMSEFQIFKVRINSEFEIILCDSDSWESVWQILVQC